MKFYSNIFDTYVMILKEANNGLWALNSFILWSSTKCFKWKSFLQNTVLEHVFIVYGFHAESSWLNSLRIITNIFHVKCDPFAHLSLVWCGWYDFDVIKHCLHVKWKYTMSRSKSSNQMKFTSDYMFIKYFHKSKCWPISHNQ